MKARVGLVLAIALITGCKSNKITGTSQNPDSTQNNANNAAQVNQYMDSLPTWAQFSPLLPDKDPARTGADSMSYDTVASVTAIDSAGNTTTKKNVPYVCETAPYSMQKTPQQIVMYSPNAAILYPGAFIQGKSYKSGIGSLLPLNFDKRDSIQVSIPAVPSAKNTETVYPVTEANVEAAVGHIVGTATDDTARTPTSISFQMESYYSQSQLALSMNASGHSLGFSAAAGGSINTDASEHTVVAQFYEKMFTVVVSPPSTPAEWFRSDFTRADLQQQAALGNIGPHNLPVYIGEVTYGRMMMFSLTSTASTDSIDSALKASYNGLFGGGSVNLSAEQKKILQTATIRVASLGGPEAATTAMIQSGDFTSYFTQTAPLSTAVPLSYDFYNLADNSLAQVTETSNYSMTTCSPVKPGQFAFLPAQSFASPVPTPFETRLVDVNGDGMADLVFNHRDANSNEVAVALGQADGTFAAPGAAVSYTATPPTGWANYNLATGDFNGDGMRDLVWNEPDSAIYVALADGSGGWTFESRQEAHEVPSDYHFRVGDVARLKHPGQKACDDLIWVPSWSDGGQNITLMVSKCDGTFLPDTTELLQPVPTAAAGSGVLSTWVVDCNKDGLADLVFNESPPGAATETEVATSNGDGTFNSPQQPANSFSTGTNDWNDYQRLVADFTGDQVPDLLFYRSPQGNSSQLYVLSGMQTMLGPQPDTLFAQGQYEYVTPVVGDVNNDGKADLILDHVTNSADSIAVDLGTSQGFSFPANPMQTYPVSTNWVNAMPPMVGDVNGDHNADVVWVDPGSPTQVFVALSKGNATGS